MQDSLKAPKVAFFAFSAGLLLLAGNAMANSYGEQITIYDGVGTNGIGTIKEDNETEPGMVQSQAWDLEGFFLTTGRKSLTIVGGYNFYKGQEDQTGHTMRAGDIFIDTNGDSVRSPGFISGANYNDDILNLYFKYDYVLDIDWYNGKFDIVKLKDTSLLKNTIYGDDYNIPSNPWLYSPGEEEIIYHGDFSTYGKTSQSDTGFSSWDSTEHYVATFDITLITLGNNNYFHNTMECGNDNLIGYAHAPEPATLLLFGAGLAGMGAFGRRRKNKI